MQSEKSDCTKDKSNGINNLILLKIKSIKCWFNFAKKKKEKIFLILYARCHLINNIAFDHPFVLSNVSVS